MSYRINSLNVGNVASLWFKNEWSTDPSEWFLFLRVRQKWGGQCSVFAQI